MPRLYALVVRLALVFALAVNGISVGAYAMQVPMAKPVTAEGSAPPCHEGTGAASSTSTPAIDDGGAAPADPHGCCGKTCGCDFVAAAALAPLAWPGLAVPESSTRAERETGTLLRPLVGRLLRPPIA